MAANRSAFLCLTLVACGPSYRAAEAEYLQRLEALPRVAPVLSERALCLREHLQMGKPVHAAVLCEPAPLTNASVEYIRLRLQLATALGDRQAMRDALEALPLHQMAASEEAMYRDLVDGER